MVYYVTRGINRYSAKGYELEPSLRKYDNLNDARSYAIYLIAKYRKSIGYFKDPITFEKHKVGLGIAFISKTKDGKEIGTVQWGQPSIYFPEGYYWHTWEPNGEMHWTQLNTDGTVKKKWR